MLIFSISIMEIEKVEVENKDDYLSNIEPVDQSIDYRQQMIDRYGSIDIEEYPKDIDSWVEDSDKIALIRFCSGLVDKEHSWAPPVMADIITKKMYYDTITRMDRKEYELEKQRDKELSVVEKELMKIKDERDIHRFVDDTIDAVEAVVNNENEVID